MFMFGILRRPEEFPPNREPVRPFCRKWFTEGSPVYGTALQVAEKFGFRVGRGFIPGTNEVILVAFRP